VAKPVSSLRGLSFASSTSERSFSFNFLLKICRGLRGASQHSGDTPRPSARSATACFRLDQSRLAALFFVHKPGEVCSCQRTTHAQWHVRIYSTYVYIKWYKVALWDMGTLRSPPTRFTTIPDNWVWPTRRPADLSVGLLNLTCEPEDKKTAWRASQGSPYGLRRLG
jgi:hypothetical protein